MQTSLANQIAVILVEPQLEENIGAAARALGNFGLQDLRLVRPLMGRPADRAYAMAAGADAILDQVRIFASTKDAIADCRWVAAVTARARAVAKPVLSPLQMAQYLQQNIATIAPVGLLFGPERSGLVNADIARAHAIITVPTNPDFASINLAQCVLLLGYELARISVQSGAEHKGKGEEELALQEELEAFFVHLEQALAVSGFLRPKEKRPAMMRNIRAMFMRADLRECEVKTLRGVIRALAEYHPVKTGDSPK